MDAKKKIIFVSYITVCVILVVFNLIFAFKSTNEGDVAHTVVCCFMSGLLLRAYNDVMTAYCDAKREQQDMIRKLARND